MGLNVKNEISNGKSPVVHYIGTASIILSIGLSFAIARSTNFALGSGENSLSLQKDAKTLRKRIKTTKQELNLAEQEVEQLSEEELGSD